MPLKNRQAIQQLTVYISNTHTKGECKQDDYLYPKLSAKDHLELFAGIRGLAHERVESDVMLWLESVDLESVKNDCTSSFSGGMKRRLSLALSTIGPSKLIVLGKFS